MSTAITPIIQEFKKNKRLRFGIGMIIVLLLGYMVLVLHDYQIQIQQTHKKVLDRLTQLQHIVQQKQWIERANKAEVLRDILEAKLWQASTHGLAQATFQKWLDTEINKIKMEKAYLRIEGISALPKEPELAKVTARLDANFINKHFNQFLLALAKQPLLIATERLEIRNTGRNPRFTLVISGYFKITHDLAHN